MPSAILEFTPGFFRSPFVPAPLLANPHAQTLFPQWHRAKGIVLERHAETVVLADGDEIRLDMHLPGSPEADAPMTLIIHGLSGSSQSHYVLGLQTELSRLGWPSAAMNCRGSVNPNRKLRAYHAGASDDVAEVFRHLVSRYGRRIAIVGYSLGGSMTLKTAAELGDCTDFLGAVTVSTPLHLGTCANRLDTGFSRIYRRHLLSELEVLWQEKAKYLRQIGDIPSATRIETCLTDAVQGSFWDFDDRLMAPLHGFRDVHDYYARCSPGQFLTAIKRPVLVIHAEDDPFMHPSIIPAENRLSPAVHFELSPRGGHVGFIGGSALKPEYYLEKRIPQFLRWLASR